MMLIILCHKLWNVKQIVKQLLSSYMLNQHWTFEPIRELLIFSTIQFFTLLHWSLVMFLFSAFSVTVYCCFFVVFLFQTNICVVILSSTLKPLLVYVYLLLWIIFNTFLLLLWKSICFNIPPWIVKCKGMDIGKAVKVSGFQSRNRGNRDQQRHCFLKLTSVLSVKMTYYNDFLAQLTRFICDVRKTYFMNHKKTGHTIVFKTYDPICIPLLNI